MNAAEQMRARIEHALEVLAIRYHHGPSVRWRPAPFPRSKSAAFELRRHLEKHPRQHGPYEYTWIEVLHDGAVLVYERPRSGYAAFRPGEREEVYNEFLLFVSLAFSSERDPLEQLGHAKR